MCNLIIQNPNGLNNFTEIDGTHLSGKGNNDVRTIESYSERTINIPSIICETFQYAIRIVLYKVEIQTIDEYSFKNCAKLSYLDLTENKITTIEEKSFINNIELESFYFWGNLLTTLPENVFEKQQKLKILWLTANKISDLPKNIFSSLTNLNRLDIQANQIKNLKVEWFENLEQLVSVYLHGNLIEELFTNIFNSTKKLERIWLHNNKLKVIPSIGILPKLTLITLDANKINAIDSRLIDNTGVEELSMIGNQCANYIIFDNSTSRHSMRNELQTCFDNYEAMFSGM